MTVLAEDRMVSRVAASESGIQLGVGFRDVWDNDIFHTETGTSAIIRKAKEW